LGKEQPGIYLNQLFFFIPIELMFNLTWSSLCFVANCFFRSVIVNFRALYIVKIVLTFSSVKHFINTCGSCSCNNVEPVWSEHPCPECIRQSLTGNLKQWCDTTSWYEDIFLDVRSQLSLGIVSNQSIIFFTDYFLYRFAWCKS
jgi:hypothetical protein